MILPINRIFVELGYRCNFQCEYCFQKPLKCSGNEICIKTFKEWLKRVFTTCKVADNIDMCFYGGEPFLYRQEIDDIINYCMVQGFPLKFCLNTNGSLLNSESIEWCQSKKITINLSLDGPYHIQTKQRKPKEEIDYLTFMEGVIGVINLQNPGATVQSTIPRDSIQNLYEIYLYMKSLRVPRWHYEFEISSNVNATLYEGRVLNHQLKKIIFDYFSTPKTMVCSTLERVLKGYPSKTILYVPVDGNVNLNREIPTAMTQKIADFFCLGHISESVETYPKQISEKAPFTHGQIMNASMNCTSCELRNYCLNFQEQEVEELNQIQPLIHCMGIRAIIYGLKEWKNAGYLPI